MQVPSEWALFPCNGKLPATPHGFKDAKRNPDPEWLKGHNVALATGAVSDAVVIDIDVKNGAQGIYSLESLEAEHGKLPETLMAETPSGGKHYHYKIPKGVSIPSKVGLRPGIDVRGDGGYVLIPPSSLDGKLYVWMDEGLETERALIPQWLVSIICEKKALPKFQLPRDASGKIPKGKQDESLFKFACSLTAQGFSPEEIKAAIMAALLQCPQDTDKPFTDDDVKRWMRGAEHYDDGKAKIRKAEEQAAKAQHRAEKVKDYAAKKKQIQERSARYAQAGLIYNKQYGTLTSCQANVETLLGAKYPLRFWRNEFSLSNFMEKQRIDDELENKLHSELERDQQIAFKREHVKHGIAELCAANKKNPLREWLDSLVWDNASRIDALGSEVFKAKNASASMLIRKWLISAVARVYDPGVKVDHMLVFIGKQGIGKSTALRYLASDEYFLDHIEDLRDKDTLLKFKGHWICEFQELSAMQRTQIEQVKAFITRKVDVYRAPYGHTEMVIPRMCVFAATTNDDHPLKQEDDENRRFWPVYCADDLEIDTEKIKAQREQIWAEAVTLYKAGESMYIQDRLLLEDLQDMQKQLSDTFDTWDEVLSPLFLEPWFFMTQAFEKLEIEPGRQAKGDIFRLARIFKRRGYVRKQIGGGEHRGKKVWIQADRQDETPWYAGSAGAEIV